MSTRIEARGVPVPLMSESDSRIALRRAAVRATLAPSVHNTQPWSLRLTAGGMDIYRDRTRQLHVLDPSGRQLLISVGCALLNARVSLAADGVAVHVHRLPDPSRPDLVARIEPAHDGGLDPGLAALDPVIELRQTNRRRFSADDVPDSVLDEVEAAAAAEDSDAVVVRDEDRRRTVATLSQRADDIENLNPAYRAELRAWTTDDSSRGDGVHDLAVPHVDGRSGDEVPIRDFDTRGSASLPPRTESTRRQCLVLLASDRDEEPDWLRAGEALERMLLEVTRHGYVASPLTQVTEVPSARAQLRAELALRGWPHVLLRIGRAPMTPSSRRRRLVEVLVEET